MKHKTLLLLSIFICYLTSMADDHTPRQKVYSVVKEVQSLDWYRNQAKLWEDYLVSDPKDASGWLNLYTSKRMLKILGGGVDQAELVDLVKSIEEAIPNTFEYHHIAYWNSQKKSKDVSHLKKAQELGPDRVEILSDLYTHYEVNGDKSNLNSTANKWFNSNDMSPDLYSWCYNMLQSTDDNAILITFCDNDSYPTWVLQKSRGIRKDVSVINISLAGIDTYRDRLCEEMGIAKLPKKMEEYKSWTEFQTKFIEHLQTHSHRPLYFAVSGYDDIYKPFEDEVYNVGLAEKWSKHKFDNIAVTKRNFEKIYLLDYLKVEMSNDISKGVIDYINTNYLVSFLTLYNHYVESEDARAAEIKELINTIAKKANVEDKVAALLNEDKENISLVVSDPRKLEKGLVKISDTLYAASTEVSNSMYELFLTDLLKQKRYDELNVAKAVAVDWESLANERVANSSSEIVFKNGHPNDPGCPVVNISYEAAVLYCKWLTETYNSLDHKKKKYKNVTFRLPSAVEWEYIARGGKSTDLSYPWGGPFVRNSKGCYLANINVTSVDILEGSTREVAQCKLNAGDGAIFTVRGDSYFPNDYGVYCLTGNAAEMVNERGITKGGSWGTIPEKAKIANNETYTKPSNKVGFRVVMIVEK